MIKSLMEEWGDHAGGKFNFAREYQFPKDEEAYDYDSKFYEGYLKKLPHSSRNVDLRYIEIEQDGEVTTFAVQIDITLG